MEAQKKPSSKIVLDVARDYVWNIPETRTLLFPAAVMMVASRFFEVLVADLYRDISRALKEQTGLREVLFHYGFIFSISILLAEMQSFIICKAGQIAYRRANRNTYRFFLKLDPLSFSRFGKGEIQNTIGRRSQAVQDIVDVFTLNFLPTILTLIFAAYKLIVNIGVIPVIIVNTCVVLYAISTVKITNFRNNIRRRVNRQSNEVGDMQIDGLINYETVLTHSKTDYEVQKYDKALIPLEGSNTSLARSLYLLNLTQRGIWCIQSIIIITISALGIFVSKIGPEELAFFISIVAILVKSLDNFGFMYGKYKQALLNMRIESEFPLEFVNDGSISLTSFSRDLVVENLSAVINGRTIFENVNFRIEKGEKIAVIGPNGAGKSTLIRMLLLLRRPSRGRVLIDGYDILTLKESSLRSIIAYVPQNVLLFNTTVIENIRYADPKIPDEEIFGLGRRLGLSRSISRLPDGYHTRVSDHGGSLSGGERQKIGIMRALASRCAVLVMDEPTASLDKKAERDILGSIVEMPDLTVIAIVHNLELLCLFDRVLCVSNGCVSEIAIDEAADMKFLEANGG